MYVCMLKFYTDLDPFPSIDPHDLTRVDHMTIRSNKWHRLKVTKLISKFDLFEYITISNLKLEGQNLYYLDNFWLPTLMWFGKIILFWSEASSLSTLKTVLTDDTEAALDMRDLDCDLDCDLDLVVASDLREARLCRELWEVRLDWWRIARGTSRRQSLKAETTTMKRLFSFISFIFTYFH